MPATVSSRGMLKASTNRVRTSNALLGSSMWENVIGLKNEERGANKDVEAMLNAPQIGRQGDGRRARREAAAEVMKKTGNFDGEVKDYESLLNLAKEQGAVVDGDKRGACKICGHLGHLTNQCRNQFSKYFNGNKNREEELKVARNLGREGVGVLDSDVDEKRESSLDTFDLSSDDERRNRRRRSKSQKKRGRSRRDDGSSVEEEEEGQERKRRHRSSRSDRDRKSSDRNRKSSRRKEKRRHRSRSR